MDAYRHRFLQLALDAEALRFGEFTLKSGATVRISSTPGVSIPRRLAALAVCYADALEAAGIGFDLLFGPAYKGIPLATALAW